MGGCNPRNWYIINVAFFNELMKYSTCIITYYYCPVKTKTKYNHVLCGMILIHHIRGLNMYKMYHCNVNYVNQIYDITCLLYSITMYIKTHTVICV